MNNLLHQLAESEEDSGFYVTATHLRAVAGLLERLARMNYDGENLDEAAGDGTKTGRVYEMAGDDAIANLSYLIITARDLMRQAAA
jgi:hypothetical protein